MQALWSFAVYKIVLGTIDIADSADVEWVYKPYMRTTKKRKFLSTEEEPTVWFCFLCYMYIK